MTQAHVYAAMAVLCGTLALVTLGIRRTLTDAPRDRRLRALYAGEVLVTLALAVLYAVAARFA